jgi:polysaccharide deacetylase 2 family uncharacterized protein YibQ
MAQGTNDKGNIPKAAALIVGLLAVGLVLGLVVGRKTASSTVNAPVSVVEPMKAEAQDQLAQTKPEYGPRPNEEDPSPDTPPPPDAPVQTAALPPATMPAAPRALMRDGAWKQKARLLPELGGIPVIALIIDDLGPDRRGTQRAIELPPNVTLSLLPYATDIGKIAAKAKAAGHEIMLHMPMEPVGDADPGPGAIDAGMSPDQVAQALDKALSAFDGYVGLNNHMGSKATQDPAVMAAVMDGLRKHGLFFLDSKTTGKSVGLDVAADAGVPAIGRDIFIDDNPSPTEIERQLTATEAYARRHGAAVAIAHPRAGSLDLIERWLAEVQSRGVYLVPISELVRRKVAVSQAG